MPTPEPDPPADTARMGTRWQPVMPRLRLLAACAFWAAAFHGNAHAATCEARSGTRAPTVVELYTSEGCSSCPPADRWLSGLHARDGVLALSFHVTYWDRLGWPDRFAQAAFTERQRALMAASGAAFVYTPQVVVDGRDWRQWPQLPRGSTAAPASVELVRVGDRVTARVEPVASDRGGRWGGYWAVVEDGHLSDVRAGENAGSRLRHDHVVRHYQPVPGWTAAAKQQLEWRVPPSTEAGQASARRVVFVLTDGASQRPLQAVALAC